MASNSQVYLTGPLDNLVRELHDFLGLEVDTEMGKGKAMLSGSSFIFPSYKLDLPEFIQALPKRVEWEDRVFLESKGVFSLPELVLRRELLRAFVENVYPFLPVLDLHSFLASAVNEKTIDCRSPISLLLFHAVMFSATAFVELKHLFCAGYTSRKEAREQFYLRARTLYDFDIESDRIVLIQALLLMTYWHETPENPKDSHYWLDVCWSLGASIGLDRTLFDSDPAMPTGTQGLWKRLWWCLYTRDVLLALNFRRPLSYRNSKTGHRPEVLACEEFNITRYPRRIVDALGSCAFLEDVAAQRHVAVAFIEKAKLCILVSEVLLLRDIGQGTQVNTSPQLFDDRWIEVVHALEAWHDDLRYPLERSAQHSSANKPAESRIIYVQRAWLAVIYLTALGTLHREAARELVSDSTERGSPGVLPGTYTKIASDTIGILENMNYRGLVQYLPTSTVAILVPVLLNRVIDLGGATDGSDPLIQTQNFGQFYRGMQVLATLGEVYPSAKDIQIFFEGMLWRGDEPMPVVVRGLLTRVEQRGYARTALGRLRGGV
ncbi:transcriptional regulator family: Fungal Specific TF [Aspergillus niger]|nr:transcriptional regulator family: Fungal Specific TF [Aspergillus niger]